MFHFRVYAFLNRLFQAIQEKIQTGGRQGGGGVEDMEFLGVLEKEHVKIPGVN